ncbi:MAG: GDP-L-fucose synthase [Deltaproteobacteria bacterium]|nr:GDP-L-fucose synthase [Deltaproteobacteria bacterium]
MNLRDSKIVVTGASGFLGRHVVEQLHARGVDDISVPRSKEHDLRLMEQCLAVTEGKDLVIHLAAHVGGIGLNREKPGELFYDNAVMGIQLIEAARRNKVKKIVVVGTICAYPNLTPVPFKEENLWNGYPEVTNAPYGVAKKALLVQLQAYRHQYGLNGVFLLPVNLYGPFDNFDPRSSHVIPALIRKIQEAIDKGEKKVSIWGDGTPTREFLYVEDAAEGIVTAAEIYEGEEPVNLGNGYEISIRELTLKLALLMGYKGEFTWDESKPNGQPRRCLDTERARNWFGFTARTRFDEGLGKTIAYWRAQKSQL